ncbi:MAG: 50S ribosomal protein L6 [Candidatus Bipolaricaulia bacterium]
MSRIGKQPINIPEGVVVEVVDRTIRVKGKHGELSQRYEPDKVSVAIETGAVLVTRRRNDKLCRSRHGLYRSLVANMVQGVQQPFSKGLILEGLGYRARMEGNKLVLELGFSHPVIYDPPPGIDIQIEGKNNIMVTGIDKQLVGQAAAEIRAFRPPEPYKGKGIRYRGEQIIRKEGKRGGAEGGLV